MQGSSLRRLHVFRTVVDCGGVNAAADHLGIAQPSVTAHLRGLEAQLGSTLFLRSRGRRNVITPTGEALYRYACDALSKSAELQTAVAKFDPSTAKTISIGAQRSLATHIMPRALASFLRGRPTTRVFVHGETQETTLKLFRAGRIDAAILYVTPAVQAYEGVIIGAKPLLIVAAPSHPLAKRKRVAFSDLRHFNFIGGFAGTQVHNLVESIFQANGLDAYNVILHMRDPVAVANAAIHGIGLACTIGMNQEVADGKLVVIETEPALPPIQIKLILRPDTPRRDLIDALIPSLVEALRD